MNRKLLVCFVFVMMECLVIEAKKSKMNNGTHSAHNSTKSDNKMLISRRNFYISAGTIIGIIVTVYGLYYIGVFLFNMYPYFCKKERKYNRFEANSTATSVDSLQKVT